MNNKKIFNMGKDFEITISKSQLSEDIFNAIYEELTSQEKKPPIKGRYLDKNVFRRVGALINWIELFNNELLHF